jgi:Helicase conserved C-terminal domain
MKRDDRTRAMDALKHDPGCEVLLVSLKAGGVGLNLTAAQRVYLMDPYWNPAVENQAVDRIVCVRSHLQSKMHAHIAFCSTDWVKQDLSLL